MQGFKVGRQGSLLQLQQLIVAVRGTLVGIKPKREPVFTNVSIDSRTVTKNSLFIPLRGEKQNGHQYVSDSIEKGASIIIIDNQDYTERKTFYAENYVRSKVVFIVVENTLAALQNAAAAYVKKFPSLIKIAVTGSSGKTTTKEIIASVVSQKYVVVMNEGNLNSETGLPLSVFRIRKEHQVGVFEMGMNRTGEIAELASVLFPQIAIITNIGTAHIGILGTKQAIAQEKKSVFMHFIQSCKGFVFEADEFYSFLSAGVAGTISPFGPNAATSITDYQDKGLDGCSFKYQNIEILFPLTGIHNFYNALAAVRVAELLDVDAVAVKTGLEQVKPLFGRSQILRGDVTLVLDCYNANPDSMEKSIAFCDELPWSKKKIYVLADMLELGASSEAEHRHMGIVAAQSKADLLFFYGAEMKAAYTACLSHCAEKTAVFTLDIEDLKVQLEKNTQVGDLVLFKGSKGMALWRAAASVGFKVDMHD